MLRLVRATGADEMSKVDTPPNNPPWGATDLVKKLAQLFANLRD